VRAFSSSAHDLVLKAMSKALGIDGDAFARLFDRDIN
jgi:hypothetical protein